MIEDFVNAFILGWGFTAGAFGFILMLGITVAIFKVWAEERKKMKLLLLLIVLIIVTLNLVTMWAIGESRKRTECYRTAPLTAVCPKPSMLENWLAKVIL